MNEALVKHEQSIVRASGDIVEALKEYQRIQESLDKAMPDCIIKIQGRAFRKKHYWRAIATAFNLNVECVKEDRKGADFLDSDAGYVVTYRATAPNGRLADGDGSCFASEKRAANQKTEHNIRSHAHTRAFNRAVSNLVGFGEVSADEVNPEDAEHDIPEHVKPTEPPAGKPDEPIPEKARRMMWGRWQERVKSQAIPENESEPRLKAILLRYGYDSTKKVCNGDLSKIIEAIESYEVPASP